MRMDILADMVTSLTSTTSCSGYPRRSLLRFRRKSCVRLSTRSLRRVLSEVTALRAPARWISYNSIFLNWARMQAVHRLTATSANTTQKRGQIHNCVSLQFAVQFALCNALYIIASSHRLGRRWRRLMRVNSLLDSTMPMESSTQGLSVINLQAGLYPPIFGNPMPNPMPMQ